MGSKLIGCGSAVPKFEITNDDLAKIVETSDEWISVRTGIRKRRVLTGRVFPQFKLNDLVITLQLALVIYELYQSVYYISWLL